MSRFLMMTVAALAAAISLAVPQQSQAASKPSCGLNNGKAASGEPIVLGAIVSRTGPDDFSASARSAEAYFKCVNANGGINGRPMRYIIGDDQWNPETAAQLGAKLVGDEKVLAMVGNSSFVECAANSALYERDNVIVIAGVGVPRECYTAKNYAPLNAGPRLSMTSAADYAARVFGSKTFVCVVPNIPNVGTWSCDGIAAWAKAHGLTVSTILIDPGSADATSIMLRAASTKPDAIVLGLPKGLMMPMLVAAEEQGLDKKIKFLSAASGYSNDVPGALGPAWDGKFTVNMEFQPLDSTQPDNANWLAVMDAYATPDVPRDTFAQAGYLAARLVTETLLKLDAATLDRAKVTKALSAVKDFKSDILCAPWYYGADAPRHNANNTLRMAVTAGKAWKAVSECTRNEDPELADIRAYEKKAGINP
jgi:branched-chain amino acid transport system substrate-binding protein